MYLSAAARAILLASSSATISMAHCARALSTNCRWGRQLRGTGARDPLIIFQLTSESYEVDNSQLYLHGCLFSRSLKRVKSAAELITTLYP